MVLVVLTAASGAAYIETESFTFTPPKSAKAGSKVEVRNDDSTPPHGDRRRRLARHQGRGAGGEASSTAPSTPGRHTFHCSIRPAVTSELAVTA